MVLLAGPSERFVFTLHRGKNSRLRVSHGLRQRTAARLVNCDPDNGFGAMYELLQDLMCL